MHRIDMFGIAAAWAVAVLLAAVSLGGLLSGNAYARETPAWVAQAIGQDWFDLLVAAPWIAICGVRARKGSYASRVLLAGAYAYAVYEMCIYAFAVHFNAFFLLYCATLGLSGYALAVVAVDLAPGPVPADESGARIAAAFLVLLGAAFALLWLAEDLPAVVRGSPPATLVETGLFTNPVHVIDLSFVLPAHVLAGVLVFRRRPGGGLFAGIVLAFGVLMAASIGGMLLVMRLRGDTASLAVAIVMFGVAAVTAAVLSRLLRVPVPEGTSSQRASA